MPRQSSLRLIANEQHIIQNVEGPVIVKAPGLINSTCVRSDHKPWADVRILALVDQGDLVDGNIGDLIVLVPQIKNSGLYVYHISTERRVGPASNIYLLSQKLF